ncbi:MAG: hypothetical protein IPK55_15235 [Streptococcus sp.]|nr:hypothetical protein [Streptococcus sp.]
MGEKETYFLNLNVIIDQLKDKRDFDLNLSELIQRQKSQCRCKRLNQEIELWESIEIGHI